MSPMMRITCPTCSDTFDFHPRVDGRNETRRERLQAQELERIKQKQARLRDVIKRRDRELGSLKTDVTVALEMLINGDSDEARRCLELALTAPSVEWLRAVREGT